MPELPEVEAARRTIEENCLGKKIMQAIIADDSKVIDGLSPDDFKASLEGKTVVAANRKGKNIWIELDSPPFPTFQFGMAGAIYIKGVAVTKYKRSAVKDDDEWPSKYSKVFLELDDGLELQFTDRRRFARVRSLENPVSVPLISELGPDVLLEPMTADEFYKALSKKKIGIKVLLLDQARIHPLQTASSIGLCDIDEVIEKAVEVGADSSQYPTSWIFHSREKKPGEAFVDGKEMEFITAGGWTSAFVPDLQKNTGAESAKAAGKRQQGKVQKVYNDSDAQDEEPESEEAAAGKSKGKVGDQKKKSRGTNTVAKRKLEESDDDEDDGGNEWG
ncbi:unnamed protein product [Withania somnifera]